VIVGKPRDDRPLSRYSAKAQPFPDRRQDGKINWNPKKENEIASRVSRWYPVVTSMDFDLW